MTRTIPTATLAAVESTLTPPKHLCAETRRWWSSVVEEYELEPHHVRLLTLAAETWDRIQQARRVIARDGLTAKTRDGVKLHPAVRVEQDGKVIFARLLRELDLDVEPPAERKRPPMLRSIRGAHAS
jgi:P27 family predicted phage terminase small subunit